MINIVDGEAASACLRRDMSSFGALVVILLVASSAALAQQPRHSADSAKGADSLRARRLDPIVVSESRTAQPLSRATASVTHFSRADLDRLPARSVAQALEFVPGIVVLQANALGESPQIVARGFYGGGETDYVLLLLDGVPLNGLVNGAANWDLVPLALVDAIEVVRGGASSMYGDVALGAVINLITRRGTEAHREVAASVGAFGLARIDGAVAGAIAGHEATFSVSARRSTGYRAHEARDAATARASLTLAQSSTRRLTLSLLSHDRHFDDPGPLDDTSLATSRRGTEPFYRFDRSAEQTHRITLDGSASMRRATVKGYIVGEYNRADVVRTLPLSADYADTKRRIVPAKRLLASLQVETRGLFDRDRLVVGSDATAGRLTSTYWELLNGTANTFAASATPVERLDAIGSGRRDGVGAFANWEVNPVERLRISAGARYDWMSDAFDASSPIPARLAATHTAWSPRLGANFRLLEREHHDLTAYISTGRSFKAPTMDQLFDQRSIPVPFPPYSITTANALLVPQTGTSIEAGVQHRVDLLPGRLVSRWSATAYQMDMRNELDFDLEQFHFVNVARSRHRGIELGATLIGPAATTAALTYGLQNVVVGNGPNAGRFLRAIPRQTWTARLAHDARSGLSLSIDAVRVWNTPFDDANSVTLPAHTSADARVSYPLGAVRVIGETRNAFGAQYNSTGFPDPGGSATRFYYPAAGRVVSIGAEARW